MAEEESVFGRKVDFLKKVSDRKIDWRKVGEGYKGTLSAWSKGSNLKKFLKGHLNRRSVREGRSVGKNKSYWLLL